MEKIKILIVEDEVVIAMEIENIPTRLGYQVGSKVDRDEKIIKNVESNKPDLVLLDIRLKDDLDGIDSYGRWV